MRTVSVWVVAALVFGSGGVLRGSTPSEAASGLVVDSLEHFNLPAHFDALIADRHRIDLYQQTHYRVETSQRPAADPFMTVRNRNPLYVRTVVPQFTSDVLAYWRALPDDVVPLRSYRAPILDRAKELIDPVLLDTKHAAAAEWIVRKLAHDGLLVTLAHVIEILGPDKFVTNSDEGIALLHEVGLPTDFLPFFQLDPATIANKLRSGTVPANLKSELRAVPFRFAQATPGFQVATESGESELGLLRMQADGGFRGGVVPGASIDVICQAVAALPNVDSVISLPRDYLEPFEYMARNWRLRRTNQVTLIGGPLAAGAWAQDNGKPGSVRRRLATITPRYASQDEGRSNFKKADSFVMEGLRAAGHEVVHSHLLFQGGDLLAVRDPKTNQRILLIGEGTIHRNNALGLTPEQTAEAFRIEFGVDRCVVIPGISYHLDFDLTVRTHQGQLVAFVNDTQAAAREIVQIGMAALARAGVTTTNLAELDRNAMTKAFAIDNKDSAAGNLQTFLLALDVIESTSGSAHQDPERRAYLEALQRMLRRNDAQRECLRGLGWRVVAMPSMTDLFRSINYLNGIHYQGGYLMPAFGGLYAALDKLAVARFQAALGTDVRIQPIRSAECQRQQGGVHCTVAAYPKI